MKLADVRWPNVASALLAIGSVISSLFIEVDTTVSLLAAAAVFAYMGREK